MTKEDAQPEKYLSCFVSYGISGRHLPMGVKRLPVVGYSHSDFCCPSRLCSHMGFTDVYYFRKKYCQIVQKEII